MDMVILGSCWAKGQMRIKEATFFGIEEDCVRHHYRTTRQKLTVRWNRGMKVWEVVVHPLGWG